MNNTARPTKTKPARALARAGDPLIAPNGQKIDPEGFEKGKRKPVSISETVIDPSEFRPLKKRNVKELPAAPNVINGIGAVFMYTILGVGDREIADVLKTDVSEIQALRKHSGYAECFQAVMDEFINANSNLLTSRIAAYSQTALETVGELVTDGKKEEVRLRASIDILDRAGVRPKDQENKQQSTKNELRIIVVDGEKNTTVNVDFNTEG